MELATLIFYCPDDDSMAEVELGFLKTPRSFHEVRPIHREGIRRDLIQYNLRVSGLTGGHDAFGGV